MADITDAAPRADAQGKGKASPFGAHIWYELITSDPEGAKDFYDSVVGWDIQPPHDDIGYRMIQRTDGGFAGGVLPIDDDMARHGAKPIWLSYINVADVDATVARIEAKGGRALMPGREIDNVGRIALVTDPQGNPFYVMKPNPPVGQEDKESDVFSLDITQRFSWNELTTGDPVAARSFYGELFGWASDDFMPMGEHGEYRFFDRDGLRIGAVCGIMPGGHPGWRYYIRVPSIPTAVEAVKAGGGTISLDPMEVPGGDLIIIGNDPQGAEFALVGGK